MYKIRFPLALCPKPRWGGAYSAPPDHQLYFRGLYTSEEKEGKDGGRKKGGKGWGSKENGKGGDGKAPKILWPRTALGGR